MKYYGIYTFIPVELATEIIGSDITKAESTWLSIEGMAWVKKYMDARWGRAWSDTVCILHLPYMSHASQMEIITKLHPGLDLENVDSTYLLRHGKAKMITKRLRADPLLKKILREDPKKVLRDNPGRVLLSDVITNNNIMHLLETQKLYDMKCLYRFTRTKDGQFDSKWYSKIKGIGAKSYDSVMNDVAPYFKMMDGVD